MPYSQVNFHGGKAILKRTSQTPLHCCAMNLSYNIKSMVFYLLRWWYGRGFGWAVERIYAQLTGIGQTLAVSVLLKTWFAPWKQITTTIGSTNFMQKIVDSMISRLLGFFVRTFMLIFALIWAILVLALGAVWLALWVVIPLSPLVLLVLYWQGVMF